MTSLSVSLLTGGSDRPYVFGLTNALTSRDVSLDLIGSEELDEPAFRDNARVNFLKLRGSQRPEASFLEKLARISAYYARLIAYAASAKPRVFHILWNNRFEWFDRTMLMLYYRCLGKKVVLTAHNVNTRRRDGTDTRWNRLSLRMQYRLASHIFVHTQSMKQDLMADFDVPESRATVIPFGINNSVPATDLTSSEAKWQLGIAQHEKAILFFGRITPYKGLEYLLDAVRKLVQSDTSYRLIIAGRLDNCETYWASLQDRLEELAHNKRTLVRVEFIPDRETEIYFKAADVLVLPYRDVYQSGVLFLAYSFGLPVIAADVGCLRDDILDGETGFLFRPEDAGNLAAAIDRYFASDLYGHLDSRRAEIKAFATRRHSWDVVAQTTVDVYSALLQTRSVSRRNAEISLDVEARP